VKDLFRVSKPVILWTAFSLLVSISFVELFARVVGTFRINAFWVIILGIALTVSLIIPLSTVFMTFRHIFKPQEKRKHLAIILLSYLSLIFCFAGAYYTMSAFSDRLDARLKHTYYRSKSNYIGPSGKIVVRRSARAFAGIETRLWSGVDWPNYRNNQLRDELRSPVAVADMISAAKKPLNKVSVFQYEERASVFSAMLYFSVVNMTTLGFGDITPASWFARLTANIQVLTGLIIFYFGLSMVIGNWWAQIADSTDKPEDNAAS